MIIGIGFDGTCVTHEFPKVGKNIGAGPVLRTLVQNGHKICLLTNRCDVILGEDQKPVDKLITKVPPGNYLKDSLDWFKDNNIPVSYVNIVPEQREFTSSTRCFCHVYIEWNNLFTPIEKRQNRKPFVNWLQVLVKLVSVGIIKNLTEESMSMMTELVMDELIALDK